MLQFVQISVEMLNADLVIRAHNRAFQQASHALNGVGVNVSATPFFLKMINGFAEE